jgi:hypothetical protein
MRLITTNPAEEWLDLEVEPGRRQLRALRHDVDSREHMMQILAVIERGEGEAKKGFWTRIGVAFQNRDQSWNLRFDFFPTRLGETTIQLRPFEPKSESDAADPEPAPEPAAPRARASDSRAPRK